MKKSAVLLFLFSGLLVAGTTEAYDALFRNQMQQARDLFQATGLEDDLSRIGWFLTFTGSGPGPELEEAALQVIRLAPVGGSAQFVLDWMDDFRECLPGWLPGVVPILEKNRPSNPELKDLYSRQIRAFTRFSTAVPEFEDLSRDAGFFIQWQFSERFGAFPVPAFDRSWPAESPQYWTNPIRHDSRTGVIVPPQAVEGPGTLYAFSQFENPVEQELIFRLFSFQNSALYLDGKMLGEFRSLENPGGRIHYLAVRVPAGTHELMIKNTQTQNTDGQFAVQVNADTDVVFLKPGTPKIALAGKMKGVRSLKVGLEADLSEDHSEAAELVRAFLALRERDRQTALEKLNALFQQHNRSQLLGGMLASIYLEGVNFLPPEEQLGTAYQILGMLVQQREGHYLENMMALGQLLSRANQMDTALQLLQAVVEANPGYCDAVDALLAIASHENLLDVRRQIVENIKKMGPQHSWAQKTLLREAQNVGDLDLTAEALSNLGELLPWDGYLARRYQMEENFPAAIDDFKKRYEIFPTQDFYPYSISLAYAQLGDHEAQRLWLEKALEVNPTGREALLDLVNLDCMVGKREQAMERIRDYLEKVPADEAFRQRLSHLEGATAFETFRVDALEVVEAAKNKPMSEGADSELLLDQLMVRLFPDGSQMRYTHLITRVLTKDGVDNESEIQLPGPVEILELRTIKADGTIYYPESFDNKTTLSLSGIGVGDFIDEEHIEYLPPAAYDEDGLDANMTFIFQGIDRIYHHSELVLIYPKGLEPEPVLLSRNMPVEAVTEEKDGFVYVRWLTQDLPPMVVEENMPPNEAIQPTASFYYNTTLDEIRDFYINNVRQRMGAAGDLLKKIQEWRESESDDRKLAETIYTEVTDAIEPGQQFFNNVNLVWATKNGNATLLLASIYRQLGLDCDIIFARPALFEEIIFDTPIPTYSYVLLRLRFGRDEVWVDPNFKGLPFGYVPFRYRGTKALVLNQDREVQAEIPKFDDASERIESNYTLAFNPDGSVKANGAEKFFGLFASQLKTSYAAMNRPEVKQKVEAGINSTFPGAEVTQVDIPENQPRGEFELKNRFNLTSLGIDNDQGLSLDFPLPDAPFLDRYGKLPVRTRPIAIARPNYNVTEIQLDLPQGMSWENKSEIRKKVTAFGRYELVIERKTDQSLVLRRTWYLQAQYIQPEDYPEFLVFCRNMLEFEDLSLTATKQATTP